MKRIRLIATGGTIACMPSGNGLVPALDADKLLDFIDIDKEGIECVDLFNMDSSNIQPEEWCKLALKILKSSWDFDGIVITHGTDTMAYTASMLSFMLRGIEIPVIFTGAQYPIAYPDSDGRRNLKNAFIAAREMRGGVYICFGNSIINGCRAVKTRTTSLNAFESINAPYVGFIANDSYFEISRPTHIATTKLEYSEKIDPRVYMLKLIPGVSTKLIDKIADCDISGVVVEAFGLGGVHNIRRDHAESFKQLIEKNIPVIITSQCLYEASSTDIYEVSRPLKEAGVISAQDMTSEAAVTKLMWILGQTADMDEIRKMMTINYCGEVTSK